MTEDKAILVINAIINKENMAEVQSYLGRIMPVFGKNGGKPVGRYKTVQQLTGNEGPDMIALIEFPNAEVINEMINGEDFNSLAEIRAKAFTKLNLVICNEM
jgi:uncharacterized protein (DUF1330 family)